MPKLRNCLILYRPSLSVWTARKKDKDESAKVNTAAGATDGAANVNKSLLPDNPELLAVTKWATSFRTWIYATTLPWDDKGARIAKVEKHLDWMMEAGDRMRAGYDLVDAFMATYAPAIEAAKFKLNGMFKHDDYPTEDQVRRKFVFGIECEPVPDHADFRIIEGLPEEEVERMVADGAAAIEQRMAQAMEDIYDRLYDVVSKFGATLVAYDNKEIRKFNDTLVTNISALTGIIPSLNLTGDRKLTDLAKAAERLSTYDLKDLRAMPEVRGAAIAEAFALRRRFGREDVYEEVKPGLDFTKLIAERRELGILPPAVDPVSLASGW